MNDGIARTRFAPSPSGNLHLGHVLAAYVARKLADRLNGECILRMEDIDLGRCRQKYADGIMHDLEWLGIHFDGDILFQSRRFELYERKLEKLKSLGVLYPCFCSRKNIAEELTRVATAPQGEKIDPYPGTCRKLTDGQRLEKIKSGIPYSWRLDCGASAKIVGDLEWTDMEKGPQKFSPDEIGDVILARKDYPVSYHLCVVIDDAEQGVTHVTRGEDLFESTHVHRLLQELLHLPVPLWYHHGLIRDDRGIRLAKRNNSLSLLEMRKTGTKPEDIFYQIASTWQLPGI